ncbi:hypothetical protein EH31_08845 [Erythrobacter longus]|uniref:Uncharacterized protein n=1 Tax=Erythrobacter longus TaxID=1044 RepID=A0A074MEA2_ERYLO|nr:tetratricopeptide repeat protein [Erythrobacter longus]KEO90188.1 hypothetical protein EH31_08845 [Erythrobacter longus]
MTLLQPTKLRLALIAAIGLGSVVPVAPAFAQSDNVGGEGLASAALVDGNASTAIELLQSELKEAPQDPAILINLGIAYAQTGNEAEARSHFEAALTSRQVIELDTANGRTTDSRRLARQAISMLDRGEFRPLARQTDQLTLRQ